jgi:hypothetical protein
MKESLFGLGETLVELARIIDECEDGELDDRLAAYLDATEGAVADKVETYCSMIREREARAQARENEAKRMEELARVDNNTADRMRRRLFEFMEKTGRQKMETATAIVRTQNAGGKLPVQLVAPVPVTHCAISYTPNMVKIRGALEAGEQLEFAKLGERSRILVIK